MLDPARESLKSILEHKQSIGEYNFSSQHQQESTPPGGALVKPKWFRYYDPAAPLPRFYMLIQSWDTAIKSGEPNDYSVCTTWGVFESKYFLIELYRARLEYPELKRKVLEQAAKHKPHHVVIEDKGSGTQLIQELEQSNLPSVKAYSSQVRATRSCACARRRPSSRTG